MVIFVLSVVAMYSSSKNANAHLKLKIKPSELVVMDSVYLVVKNEFSFTLKLFESQESLLIA